MDPLPAALALAGLLIGATGTWSPCGFSMIETVGPTGHTGGPRATLAACATFAPAAVLGGAITFGLLGWVGEALLGPGGFAAPADTTEELLRWLAHPARSVPAGAFVPP